jgi:hypothetical protein
MGKAAATACCRQFGPTRSKLAGPVGHAAMLAGPIHLSVFFYLFHLEISSSLYFYS